MSYDVVDPRGSFWMTMLERSDGLRPLAGVEDLETGC
jgi:hypothetical protein